MCKIQNASLHLHRESSKECVPCPVSRISQSIHLINRFIDMKLTLNAFNHNIMFSSVRLRVILVSANK